MTTKLTLRLDDTVMDNLETLMHLVQSGEVQEAGTVVTLS